ncbi:MAG TPA: AAA family ATPase [Hyphomicrobiales bacterium]|jgi:chromosome partitioning protein
MSIWTTLAAPVSAPPAIPVLSVGNLKGGVGKTSVAANLAVALTMRGCRVLAIDVDFQASLSVALPPNIMPRHEIADGGVHVLLSESYDMFHNSQITAMGLPPFSGLSLVRTSLELADVEDKLFAAFILGQREQDPRFALARKLSDPRLARDFDIVIIDTPPRLTMASINAFCASTHVLIPTALTSMSQSGAVTFIHYLKEFRKSLCPSIDVLGVLATFTAQGTLRPAEEKVLDELQDYLNGIEVWRDVFLPFRQPIANNQVLQNPDCRERFERLAHKVATKLGLNRDGNTQGRQAHRGSRFGGAGLSQ